MNAGKYVLHNDDDLTYYEGYWMWSLGMFPVHHAWLVDGSGNVIDLTAEDCERKAMREGLGTPDPSADLYFGMAVPTWFVREQALKTKIWGFVSPGYLSHLAEEKEAA